MNVSQPNTKPLYGWSYKPRQALEQLGAKHLIRLCGMSFCFRIIPSKTINYLILIITVRHLKQIIRQMMLRILRWSTCKHEIYLNYFITFRYLALAL